MDAWLSEGPPAETNAKIGTIVEIVEMLALRLREGTLAAAARRPAEADGGRSMLEVIAGDDHEWLLGSVRSSFDFASSS